MRRLGPVLGPVLVIGALMVLLGGCGTDDIGTSRTTTGESTVRTADLTPKRVVGAISDVCDWKVGTWSSVATSRAGFDARNDMTTTANAIRYDLVTSIGGAASWKLWSLVVDDRMYLRAGEGGWVTARGPDHSKVASTWKDTCRGALPVLHARKIRVGKVSTEGTGQERRHVLTVTMAPGTEIDGEALRSVHLKLAGDGSVRSITWATEGDPGTQVEVTVSPDVDATQITPPIGAVEVSRDQIEQALGQRSTDHLGE